MSEVEFELGEHSFKLGPLKVRDSMKGWAIVAHVLLPLLAELASDEQNLSASIANAIAGVERLPELQELCSKVCKVESSGKSVPVKDFQELIFARRRA